MSFALFRAVGNIREADTKVTKATEEVTKLLILRLLRGYNRSFWWSFEALRDLLRALVTLVFAFSIR